MSGSRRVRKLAEGSSQSARLTTLFHEDASLAEGVTWLIEQHLRALEGREGAEKLKSTVLAILGDGLLPDGYEIEKVDSEGLWVRREGQSFPLREMSDGYRTVAALVVDLVRQIEATFGELTTEIRDGVTAVTVPGVVLIDEVDAHLHVSWQRRIGGWLKAHFPNLQFIVTTHSPYICQSADPGGLIRLPGPDEQVPPQVVGQDLYERIVYGSGDDAVLSELFGLETLYSEKAEALRGELVELEMLVLDGEASPGQIERFHRLQELLTSSPVARVAEVAAGLQSRSNRTR